MHVPFFNIFASPGWSPLRMRTKVVSFFLIFPRPFKQNKKMTQRPQMSKKAARGSCFNRSAGAFRRWYSALLLVFCFCLSLQVFAQYKFHNIARTTCSNTWKKLNHDRALGIVCTPWPARRAVYSASLLVRYILWPLSLTGGGGGGGGTKAFFSAWNQAW